MVGTSFVVPHACAGCCRIGMSGNAPHFSVCRIADVAMLGRDPGELQFAILKAVCYELKECFSVLECSHPLLSA